MTVVGVLVDGVLAVLLVETLYLGWRTRRRSSPVRFIALLPNLAAGLFLVLALRVAVHGQGGAGIAACLALAGLAHLVDLRRRFAR